MYSGVEWSSNAKCTNFTDGNTNPSPVSTSETIHLYLVHGYGFVLPSVNFVDLALLNHSVPDYVQQGFNDETKHIAPGVLHYVEESLTE